MLGTTDRPQLHAKAAESHGLLKFMACLLNSHLGRFRSLGEESYRQAKFLKEAADAAVRFDEVFQTGHRRLDRSELQRAFNSYIRFLSFYKKAGGPLVPKCHFMIHLVQRARFKGNPKMYSTYRDESFNGLIAKIARSCHRRTWANAVHWKCHALHQKNHKKGISSNSFNKPKPEGNGKISAELFCLLMESYMGASQSVNNKSILEHA